MNTTKAISVAISLAFFFSGNTFAGVWYSLQPSTVKPFPFEMEDHGVIINHEMIDPLVLQRKSSD